MKQQSGEPRLTAYFFGIRLQRVKFHLQSSRFYDIINSEGRCGYGKKTNIDK